MERKILVLTKGAERFVYRFTPGSEGSLLAALVAAARDPGCALEWGDVVPVLVRFREFIFGTGAVTYAFHRVDV